MDEIEFLLFVNGERVCYCRTISGLLPRVGEIVYVKFGAFKVEQVSHDYEQGNIIVEAKKI